MLLRQLKFLGVLATVRLSSTDKLHHNVNIAKRWWTAWIWDWRQSDRRSEASEAKWHMLKIGFKAGNVSTLIHRRGQRGHGPSRFLAHFVTWCFREAVSQTKYCCSLKVKRFGPKKNFGLATPLLSSTSDELLSLSCFCSAKCLQLFNSMQVVPRLLCHSGAYLWLLQYPLTGIWKMPRPTSPQAYFEDWRWLWWPYVTRRENFQRIFSVPCSWGIFP